MRIQQNLTNIINGSKANVLSNRGMEDYQLFIVKRCMDHRKRTSSEWVTPYVFQTSSSFHSRRWIYREPTNMAGGQYDDWQYGIWTTLITAGCRVGLITRLVGPLVLIHVHPSLGCGLLKLYGAVANLAANRNASFKWKLRYYWLQSLRQRHIIVVESVKTTSI